jgi:hypothetical protein
VTFLNIAWYLRLWMTSERRNLLTQQHKPFLKVSRKLGP